MDAFIPSVVSANGNLIVVAGAGTGKTYRLVQTCLERVRAGVSIEEILIVTFTKAAAAELRQRIARALQEAFAKEPDSAWLARQIALLDRAQISTLHSFCLEIVSRNFSDLGLSPRLVTLEAGQAAILENETLDDLFESFYAGETDFARSAQRLLLEWFRGDDRPVRELSRKLHAFTQTRSNREKWFAKQRAILRSDDPKEWRAELPGAVEELVRRWRPVIEAQESCALNPARAMLLAAMDKLDVARIREIENDSNAWPRGSKGKFKEPVKGLYADAAMLADCVESDSLLKDWHLTREVALGLLDITEAFAKEFARMKRERGLVDFHDLEQFSLRLLWDEEKDRPSGRAEFWRKKLKCIFVDEYQDINWTQDRIIRALAREDEGGNRFLVGDVKQSIYGFRQAEPDIFLAYEEDWNGGEKGAREYLVANWRSHERILDFVNSLFGRLMTKDVGGVSYDERARLTFAEHPERVALSASANAAPRVEVHLAEAEMDETGEEEEEGVQELDKSEREAEIVAGLCWRMVKDKQELLPLGRAVEFGDIVILMRSAQTEAEVFAKVFSRWVIPFDVKRTGFFESIEITDLTSLLTILDNPRQDIPLIASLRSPIGCFSVEDLAAVRVTESGCFWDALQAIAKQQKGEVAAKARKFLETFQRWRNLSRHTSLAQRLEIILEEASYEAWALAQDRGEQRRANVRRLVEFARQFDEFHGEGLYPFLQFVEDQMTATSDVAPPRVDSRGAVRLMTVHQSKGLQFPIVLAAGLGKKFNRRDFTGAWLLDDKFGLCLKARPPAKRRQYETFAFWSARHRQEKRALDEEMRILYVALTRAQHRLILVGSPSKTAQKNWEERKRSELNAGSMLDWIGPWLAEVQPAFLSEACGEAKDWTWQWHGTIPIHETESAKPDEPGPETPDKKALANLRRRLDWKYAFAAATLQEAKTSATALRRAIAEEPELARPVTKTKPPRGRGDLLGTELGQAAHRILELADFSSFASEELFTNEIARLRGNGLISELEAESVAPDKLLAFWRTELGRELLKHSASLRRELAFTARFSRAELQVVGAPVSQDFGNEEFIVVQGAADLVAVLPEELWLVDFKTDRAPEHILSARLKEYSLQLRIYAAALSRIYRRPVTRASLFFIELGRAESISLDISR